MPDRFRDDILNKVRDYPKWSIKSSNKCSKISEESYKEKMIIYIKIQCFILYEPKNPMDYVGLYLLWI